MPDVTEIEVTTPGQVSEVVVTRPGAVKTVETFHGPAGSAADAVSSVDASTTVSGLSFSGGPITGIGTLALSGTVSAVSESAVTAHESAITITESQISDLGSYLTSASIDTLAELNAIVADATLGDSSDFATAAQGATADTATQPGDNISTLTNDSGFTTNTGTVTSVAASTTVSGLSWTGSPVTTSGTLALTGTVSAVTEGAVTAHQAALSITESQISDLSHSDSFTTIAVSGQSNVVADSATDTLTLVAGSNVTITTDAGTDTITIAATGGGGGASELSDLTDVASSTATNRFALLADGTDWHARAITEADISDLGTYLTGNETITLSGDVSGSGTTAITATIASDAVTYDKMQDTTGTDVILGRSTAGAGTVEEITCTAAGRALLDDASASAQRTTLGVDAAGTDNSTDVTLAGSLDYLTISGQEITRNAIDLSTDTTGALPIGSHATSAQAGQLGITIDGGGSAITTGVKGYLRVPYACTINSAEVVADQSGSVVVDVWKDSYANFPPVDADSITASAPPTLSSAQKSQDATLTGWTTSLSEGEYLGFNVDSASTVTRVTVVLEVTKA